MRTPHPPNTQTHTHTLTHARARAHTHTHTHTHKTTCAVDANLSRARASPRLHPHPPASPLLCLLWACFRVDGSVLHERCANSAVKATMTSRHSAGLCSRYDANTLAPLLRSGFWSLGPLLQAPLGHSDSSCCFLPRSLSPPESDWWRK